MKFLNPAGLWLLLGVPVLILIYLIRPHHEERAVSSTFMWKLSQRFMKRQLPMQRLRRFLLFTLELLLLISAALMLARPALITGKSTEYIAIIDASASMQTKDEKGVSRFDRAIEQAKELTGQIDKGHRVTVILAGDNAQFLIQSADAPGRVRVALDEAVCLNGGCDTEKALTLARQLCSRGKSEVIFYTDTPCQRADNMQVVDLNEGAWNVSVDAVSIANDDDGGMYAAATLTSNNRDANIHVGLRIDGVLSGAKAVTLFAGQPQTVLLPVDENTFGSIFEVFVDENDGLALDNRYSLCTQYTRNYNVLVVSPSPFYLENVLVSLENCSVTTLTSLDQGFLPGYDLYIFDGLYPETYPTDGSVIQFGVEKLPEGLEAGAVSNSPTRLSKLSGNHQLYENLPLLNTTVASHTALTGSAQWEKLLMCATQPVCMTTVNDLGIRTTVFSFDLHNTNLPMQTDFVVLMKNLVEASVFDLVPGSDFSIGTTIPLAVLPRVEQMHLQLPDGTIQNLVPENGRCSVAPTDPGIHTAVVTTAAGGEYADFYVHIPPEETTGDPHGILSVTIAESTADAPDAITELWGWLALIMLILVVLEWRVYFREQY